MHISKVGTSFIKCPDFALMIMKHANLGGLDIKNPVMAVGAFAAGLLDYKTHGSALVQQPQLPVLALLVPRVAVDPTVQQSPVEISDQTTDVTGRVGLPTRPGILKIVDVLLKLVVPQLVVTFIEGVDLPCFRDLDFLLG